MNTCVVCFNESETLCQRCRTPYCSRQCQTDDWPCHKLMCIPMPALVTTKKPDFEKQRNKANPNDSSVPLNQQNKDSTASSKPESKASTATVTPENEASTTTVPPENKASTATVAPENQTSTAALKQENKNGLTDLNAALRPPNTKKPPERLFPVISNVENAKKSIFDNPFKRNSQNLSFKSNEVKKTENVAGGLTSVFKKIQQSNDQMPSINSKETSTSRSAKILSATVINKTEAVAELTESVPVPRKTNDSVSLSPKPEVTTADKPRSIDPDSTTASPTPTINEAKTEMVAPPQQINEDNDRPFTMKDIDVAPLSPGKRLVCLDSSNIGKGYVSSCIDDKKAIALVDRLSAKVSEYCTQNDSPHSPEKGELCLGKYVEDQQWYRAVVSEVYGDTFEIVFIDFGNFTTVSSKAIRKMPREFMHHCLQNKCYIKGFPAHPTSANIKDVQKFFDANPVFDVLTLVPKNDAYEIEIKFSA